MKKISVLVPTFNEEKNVKLLTQELTNMFGKDLSQYDYEIVFIDNYSIDATREILRKLCQDNKKIRAIFNARNFGQFNSPYYGLQQTTGDCTILLCADFQDPIEMIPQFVHEWENGYRIVIGQKTTSQENKLMYFFRSCYYKLIKKFSDISQIEHFTGFGLYDSSFIKILRELKDSRPFLRGIVAELGYKQKIIPYEQKKRRAGKTSNNFYRLYDAAMLSFTSYTKIGLRLATFLGVGCGIISFIIAVVYLILKLIYWERFTAGMAPAIIGMFFLGSMQLFFMGIIGEYILTLNSRAMNRPLVIEEERINFDEDFDDEN